MTLCDDLVAAELVDVSALFCSQRLTIENEDSEEKAQLAICIAMISWSLKSSTKSGMCSLNRLLTRGAYTASHLLAGSSELSFSKASHAFCSQHQQNSTCDMMAYMRRERPIPILRFVRYLDELNDIPISMTIFACLMRGKGALDESFCCVDVSGRRGGPHLRKLESAVFEYAQVVGHTLYAGFPLSFLKPSTCFRFLEGNKLSYWFRVYLPKNYYSYQSRLPSLQTTIQLFAQVASEEP